MSTEWTEFNDRELVNWKRVRAVIEHEDNLTHHRLTWLLTSQGFLFAAFALVFQASTKNDVRPELHPLYQIVLGGISILGIFASFLVRLMLRAAETQLEIMQTWWERQPGAGEPAKHPPIRGGPAEVLRRRIPGSVFPFAFILAWVVFILVVLFDFIRTYASHIGVGVLVLAILLGIFFLGMMVERRAHHSNVSQGTAARGSP